MKKPLAWLPVYIDSWLFGSTADELAPDEESTWLRIFLLSGKDEGFIRANETIGYPLPVLAGMIRRDLELVERTVEKCVVAGKIERRENGILYISSWEKYALSGRYRRKLEEDSSPDPSSKKKIEKRRGEESKGKRNTVPKKRNSVPEKRNSPPPASKIREEEVDKDGLLPIPKGISFKAQDALKEFRAEIRNDLRNLASGKRPGWITREGVEKKIGEYNQRVGDLL